MKTTAQSSPSKKKPLRKTTMIRQTAFVRAMPSEIYDAFLNEKIHTEFTGAKATCERRVGGIFTAWDGYISGTNIKLENGRRIIQEWKTTEWPEGCTPSLIELHFIPKNGGTDITMIQKNIPPSLVNNYKRGWKDFYWNPLKEYFKKK